MQAQCPVSARRSGLYGEGTGRLINQSNENIQQIPQTSYGIKVVVDGDGGQLDVTDLLKGQVVVTYWCFIHQCPFLFCFLQDLTCLFEIYLKPLQNETFLTQDEVGVGAPETR